VRARLDLADRQTSASEVQRLAEAAYQDQRSMLERLKVSIDHIAPLLVSLAALGDHGRQSGNCHRDLVRFLGSPGPAPSLR
jgi:hypothetical protein